MVYYKLETNDKAHANKITNVTWHNKDKKYNIIKYIKSEINTDNVYTLGLFRSVIMRNDRLLAFSPPKGLDKGAFMKKHPFEECIIEEYVEGTMINLFYDDNEWEISTRSRIGANLKMYKDKLPNPVTFRSMFLEACNNANFDFENLDQTMCYSFVLQHPNNRIVVPFTETKLYLVACYKLCNKETDFVSIQTIDIDSLKKNFADTSICYPKTYTNESYAELEMHYGSSETDYKIVGVMVKHTKSGDRTKFRNPNYEMVRKLRGNNPKEQYNYLVLRQENLVDKYLQYYPEETSQFNKYRKSIHSFTNQLFTYYVECYIKKQKKYNEFPYQYRHHMYAIHQIYIKKLRQLHDKITKGVVIEYVNKLPPAKLMFSINFQYRYNTQIS